MKPTPYQERFIYIQIRIAEWRMVKRIVYRAQGSYSINKIKIEKDF